MRRTAVYYAVLIMPLALRAPAAGLGLGESAQTPDGELPEALEPPRAQLAAIDGYDDDKEYVQAIADRADRLASRTVETTDLGERIDLLLAAANMILAYELEPACSTKLLRLGGRPNPHPDGIVAAAIERADQLLARADALLRGAPKAETAADRLQAAKQHLSTLHAFAQTLRAFLLSADGNRSQTLRKAASSLAILLEDNSTHVVAAATLWHAILRSRTSEPARAKSVLPLALSRPSPSSLPHAFFSRLVRCRLLAANNGHAAALALLTQIEDRCDSWLAAEPDRADAMRTTALMEIQILADWYDHLKGDKDLSKRRWCLDRATALTERHFATDHRSVLRLTPAVPIVVQAAKRTTTAPANNP